MRVAGRAEQDGVCFAQRFEAIGRHHHPVLAIVIAAPVEILEFEFEMGLRGSQCGKHFAPGRNHFLADAVAGDTGDSIGFHGV